MASPKSSGRMIRKSISESEKIASLSPEAAVLFVMLIPHFNAHGKMPGGPGVIKDDVVPLIPYFTYDNLPHYLKEISDKTNVKWFRCGTKWWLHSLNFNTKHQDLRTDRMGSDDLPGYTLQESRTTPGLLPDSPSRAEGFKVLREEENLKPHQQQHAGACEQLAEEVDSRMGDLQRLFPTADIPVVREKLLHHYRDKPRQLDPWAIVLKWFQREFKAVALLPVAARASPGGYAEQWRSNAAREAEAFIYGGTNDENNEQCGRAAALSGGNGGALQGAHAAAGS